MLEPIRRMLPAVAAVVAAAAAFLPSWNGLVRSEAAAWLQLDVPTLSSAPLRNRPALEAEMRTFIAAHRVPRLEAGPSPNAPPPGTTTRLRGADDPLAAVVISIAPRAPAAVQAANQYAERLVAAWDRRAEEEAAARLRDLERAIAELDARQVALREQEISLRKQHPELAHADDAASLDREVAALSAELDTAARELSYLEGRRDHLAQELDTLSEMNTAAEEHSAVAASAARLAELNAELAELRLRYTSKNPRIQALEERIAAEEQRLEAERQRAASSAPAVSSPRQRLAEELAVADGDVAAAHERVAALVQRLAETRRRNREWMALLPALTRDLDTITAEHRRLAEQIEPLVAEREQLKSSALAGAGWAPRLRIDPPATRARRAGGGWVALISALAAGIAALVVLVLLRGAAGRAAVAGPGVRELADRFGVPVLAVFPRKR